MQKIADINKWARVEAGKALNFAGTQPRRVRLEVNAPAQCGIWYVDTNGNVTFLATVSGRDVIEFKSTGEFALQFEGDCYIYTVDSEDFSFSIPDAVTFTEIMTRRARNPEVELMNYMMKRNMEMMRETQKHEFERMWTERERIAAANAAQPAPAGDVAAPISEPEPDGGAGTGTGDTPVDGGDNGGAKKAK